MPQSAHPGQTPADRPPAGIRQQYPPRGRPWRRERLTFARRSPAGAASDRKTTVPPRSSFSAQAPSPPHVGEGIVPDHAPSRRESPPTPVRPFMASFAPISRRDGPVASFAPIPRPMSGSVGRSSDSCRSNRHIGCRSGRVGFVRHATCIRATAILAALASFARFLNPADLLLHLAIGPR